MVVYLGLGSNLGDRGAEIARAVAALQSYGPVEAQSRLYETLPEGGARQPHFLNAAVRMQTALSAPKLLLACLDIERAQGRVRPRGQDKAPRTIDLDVLLYGDEIIDDPDLQVPHPRLLLRPFVRIPLAEVALPGLHHPITGELLDRCASDPAVVPLLGRQR